MRRSAGVSQAQFARLIGVPVRTVQNWEQGRTRPAGPARALLKIVALDPAAARSGARITISS
jgi:putative transcriptional regulator